MDNEKQQSFQLAIFHLRFFFFPLISLSVSSTTAVHIIRTLDVLFNILFPQTFVLLLPAHDLPFIRIATNTNCPSPCVSQYEIVVVVV